MTEQCTECSSPVAAEEWHPVVTDRDDDGDLRVRTFCSEACRSAWTDDD